MKNKKKILDKIIKKYGGKPLIIPMRDCDDVPKFIEAMNKAHERTAHSTLHFGPKTPRFLS